MSNDACPTCVHEMGVIAFDGDPAIPKPHDYIRWCAHCGTFTRGTEKFVPHYAKHGNLHDQVFDFHMRFGQSVGEKPHVPDEKTLRFRLSLITEEFFELLEAAGVWSGVPGAIDLVKNELLKAFDVSMCGNVNLPEMVDAMADLDYVVEGTRITMGVDGAPIAEEVQRANMAKLPSYVAEKDAQHQGVVKREPVDQQCVHCGNHRRVFFEDDGSTSTEENCLACGHEGGHEYPPLGEPVKREDGKVLKPKGWLPPDIEGVLRKQGWEG